MERTYQEILWRFFNERRAINAAYSLRAFARDLKIQPSHLSEMLTQKKGLSLLVARRIATRLRMNREDRTEFLDLVESQDARSAVVRQRAQARVSRHDAHSRQELDRMAFEIIKDWHHFALRAYIAAQGKNFSLNGAARYFKLPVGTLSEALERLKILGLVTGKKFLRSNEKVTFAPRGIPLHAKRLHHLQLLERAQHAYLEQSFETRDYMTSILAIDPTKLDEAKQLIKKFHADMNQVLVPSSVKLEEVYCFATQLYCLKGPVA